MRLGEGWTGDEALAIALYAAASADSVEDAVRIAANHDGDSDSTASIAGQLRSPASGDVLPRYDWARPLDLYDPLIELAFDGTESTFRRSGSAGPVGEREPR